MAPPGRPLVARAGTSRSLVTRRRFLVALGGGVVASVITGCTSDTDDDTATPSSDDGATTTTATDDGTTTTGAGDTTDASADDGADADADQLRWERASFGFVSAYVLVRNSSAVVVDTGTGDVEVIGAALDALGAGFGDVSDVVLTHSHGDHVGGLAGVLEAAPSAAAWAGTADLGSIQVPDASRLAGLDGGEEILGLEVIPTPGHTAGHVSVFDGGTGVLVAGDALNVVDGSLEGANPQFTDDVDQAAASIAALVEGRDVRTILVGHGDPLVDGAGAALAQLVSG